MGMLDRDEVGWNPDEPNSTSERFAAMAAELVALRFEALHLGSPHLAGLLERAIVQTCREAGIGPESDDEETVVEWLRRLLTAAAAAKPGCRKPLPVCLRIQSPLDQDL